MQLPENVRRGIEERAAEIGVAALRRAADSISEAYRSGTPLRLNTPERLTAYLATRMPATYAAAHTVLRELRERLGSRAVESVLDVGAGSGAASLAARQFFPGIGITMLERDAGLASAAHEWAPDAALISNDIARMESFPPHDLVIAAYSLGELQRPPLDLLWRAARVALVVIEPGTPIGYSLILKTRDSLLQSGAHAAAPCPAGSPCPLTAADWCHFAARAERSRVHRLLKNAELNYEDEKFSYIALTRDAVEPAAARVIRRPAQQPGLIVLNTCTPSGVLEERVRKRDRNSFRAARRAVWGGAWR